MSEDIEHTEHGFNYKISFDDLNVTIHAVHIVDLLEWSKTITSSLTESTSEYLKVSLSPKNLYKAFHDYCQGTLSDRYKIEFPEIYDRSKLPL